MREVHRSPPGDGERAPAHTLTPVNAALVGFASQTLVVPNTPALTYGFLRARKLGFEGDMALFLQEVIDGFYPPGVSTTTGRWPSGRGLRRR